MSKAQAISGAVLDAVLVEAAAANKQLEKLKMILDFTSSRVDNLHQQIEAAHKNKAAMGMLSDHFGG